MILADTSIWIDHFRRPDPPLIHRIETQAVAIHRLVIEELAVGYLPQRKRTLHMLARLPMLSMIEMPRLISFIERNELAGRGIGATDAHLLATARESDAPLWTRDKRLAAQALRLGCLWRAPPN